MAKNIQGASNLFSQQIEDNLLFAVGAEGSEDLGETINMRNKLTLPTGQQIAQVSSKTREDGDDGDDEDEDEEQQIQQNVMA
jgi:hypothetical protein